MRFLLDTNVISQPVQREPDGNVVAWLQSARQQDLAISVLTIGELVKGADCVPSIDRRTTR